MTDVSILAAALTEYARNVGPKEDYSWPNPALNVLDCVLSLHHLYDGFVVPRVKAFARRHPEVNELSSLLQLIEGYDDPEIFCVKELNCHDRRRAYTLHDVTSYFVEIQQEYPGQTEQERLHQWAISVCPSDYVLLGIAGFGLSGFQYMRMLFGAQTTKPDVHIQRFVSEIMGYSVNAYKALLLLEQAAQIANVPLRDVDNAIWKERARA